MWKPHAKSPVPHPNKILLFSAQNITANWQSPVKCHRKLKATHSTAFCTLLYKADIWHNFLLVWLEWSRRPLVSPVPYGNETAECLCHITAHGRQGPWQGLFSWGGRRGNPSQKLILTEVHSLDYVSAIVKHPSNILRVYCACEMWITVVFTISAGCADSLK